MLLDEASRIRKNDIKENPQGVGRIRNGLKMTVFLLCYYLETTIIKENKGIMKDDMNPMLQEKENKKKKNKVGPFPFPQWLIWMKWKNRMRKRSKSTTRKD